MTSLNRANDVRSSEPFRHGAYLCLPATPGKTERAQLRRLGPEVRALAERLGLRDEFDPGADHPPEAIGLLRRIDAHAAPAPGAIADDGILHAGAVVHVASTTAGPVAAAIAGLARLIEPLAGGALRVLGGVARPMRYTGNETYNFSYAHRVLQQPGDVAPHAFLLPMSKTAAWWRKDWMERHTYFLPRYDDDGRMVKRGHVLAAAPGVDALMRRTYLAPAQPAPAGDYDFVTYFECSDAGVATFHEVCAALRDVASNPEWAFVREGPTWHGRRVADWEALFD